MSEIEDLQWRGYNSPISAATVLVFEIQILIQEAGFPPVRKNDTKQDELTPVNDSVFLCFDAEPTLVEVPVKVDVLKWAVTMGEFNGLFILLFKIIA